MIVGDILNLRDYWEKNALERYPYSKAKISLILRDNLETVRDSIHWQEHCAAIFFSLESALSIADSLITVLEWVLS